MVVEAAFPSFSAFGAVRVHALSVDVGAWVHLCGCKLVLGVRMSRGVRGNVCRLCCMSRLHEVLQEGGGGGKVQHRECEHGGGRWLHAHEQHRHKAP